MERSHLCNRRGERGSVKGLCMIMWEGEEGWP